METRPRFIAPHRLGTWVVTTLGTALAALVISVWGLMESRATTATLQVELLKFDERIKALEAPKPAAMQPAMPIQPTMPMQPAAPAQPGGMMPQPK